MQSNNRKTSPQRPRAPTKSENITLPEQHNTPPRSSLSKLIPSPSRTSVVPTVLNTSTPSSSSPTQSSSKPLLQTQGRFSLINVLAEEEQEDEGFGPVIVNDEMVVQDLASVPDPDSLPRASRVNGPDTSDHPRKLATDHNPGLAMVHLRAKVQRLAVPL